MANQNVRWRRLKSTEIIRRGDEWWDEKDKIWNQTTADSWGYDAWGFKVRRKISPSQKSSKLEQKRYAEMENKERTHWMGIQKHGYDPTP